VASPAGSNTDFAPAAHPCPTCGAECKRHSIYVRRIKDIGLDGPIVLEIPVGNYRCLDCCKFFKPEVPFASKNKQYTTRAIRKATVAVQQDKTTYTALPNRLERDFAIRPAKSTAWLWFQQFAGGIDVQEYLRWACSRFSGQLSVDSVSDGGMQMWFATDPLNRDLILGYYRDQHANAETLTKFLTSLRDDYGIEPKLFTCDDANVFDNTPQKVWLDVPVQLCHFHILKNLNYMHLRHSLTERLKRYKPVKPPKEPRPDGKPLPKNSRGYASAEFVQKVLEWKQAQEVWGEMHQKRRLFFKTVKNLDKPESIKRNEGELLQGWCERYPALGVFRRFILDFYALMSCKDSASADLLRKAFLARWEEEAKTDAHMAHALKLFGDDKWFARLFPFTAFENAHRTTNSTERANRWFRKRQKTHYRNRKEHAIKNMLHADLIYRRERTPPGKPPVRLKEKPISSQRSA
jgi:hypothetical protein